MIIFGKEWVNNMAVSSIFDEFSCDINLTRSRYQELIISENQLQSLLDLILKRHIEQKPISVQEIDIMYNLYFKESEEKQ